MARRRIVEYRRINRVFEHFFVEKWHDMFLRLLTKVYFYLCNSVVTFL